MSSSRKVEEYIIIVLFSLMILILGCQITLRYLFSFTFSWAEQLVRIMFVWITFAGISLAATKGMHLRVSIIKSIIPDKWAKKVVLIGDTIAIIFSLLISYHIILATIDIINKKQKLPILWDLPMWVMYVPGFLGMIGLSVRLIQYSVWPYLRETMGKN